MSGRFMACAEINRWSQGLIKEIAGESHSSTVVTSKEMSHSPATTNSQDNKLCFFICFISAAPCGFEALQLRSSPDIQVSYYSHSLLEDLQSCLSYPQRRKHWRMRSTYKYGGNIMYQTYISSLWTSCFDSFNTFTDDHRMFCEALEVKT